MYNLITKEIDLPELPEHICTLYLDVETTFNNRKTKDSKAVHPYAGDRVCGVAFTFDDCEEIWYIALRHQHCKFSEFWDGEIANLSLDIALPFLQDLLNRSDDWVNHNVKFDAHFLHVDGIKITSRLIDTVTLAQLVDMQSQEYGYDLKGLAKRWCNIPSPEKDIINLELVRRGTKDYGLIPAHIMGDYACADVKMNRVLWKEIQERKYEKIEAVWDLEVELTGTLFEIESRGLNVDTEAMSVSREQDSTTTALLENQIRELGFTKVVLTSPTSLVKLVVGELGLPVIVETDKGNPSIDAEAIRGYRELSRVKQDEKLSKFFELLQQFKKLTTFLSLYTNGWLPHITPDNVLHAMYRQTVATGRMACTSPNMQQLTKEAKYFLVPAEGNVFASFDYSQIEYRVIASFTRDKNIFDVYKKDPATDFHQYVADICNVDRFSGKTLNFGIAYGLSEKGVIRNLAKSLGITASKGKGKRILEIYHRRFSGIRRIATLAKRRAEARGWIRTLLGRRRALRRFVCRKAFNTSVQGTAADIMKERLNAVNKDKKLRLANIVVIALVHDEFLFEGPEKELRNPEMIDYISKLMCATTIELGIPLLVDSGISEVSWGKC